MAHDVPQNASSLKQVPANRPGGENEFSGLSEATNLLLMLPDQNVAPMTEHNTPILFAADIRPNRSLSRRGLMILVAALASGGLITMASR